MNRFTFSIKRVFHRSVQLGVMMTRSYGLTPARFDLMRAIECQCEEWVPHRDVRELLGVRGPTVSRMVTSLVEGGLLERRRDPDDARRRQIRLTRLGKLALRSAFQHIVKSGYMREVTRRAASDYEDYGRAKDGPARRCVEKMMSMLNALQRNLGDASRFEHRDDGGKPAPIRSPIFQAAHDEEGNWPGDNAPLYVWIAENLPSLAWQPDVWA